MTIQILPFFSDPSWFATITLEGVPYVMQFDFNQRAYSWYMSIADSNGVDIYNGVKLVTGFSLLAKCKDPRAPPGALFVFSNTSDASPPGLYELIQGGRCTLYYVTSDWLTLLATPAGLAIVLAQLAANTQTSSTSTYGQPPNG
jgi:hypothetical protein